MNPVFVNPGEPIKASWANDVVSSIRSNSGDPNKLNVQAKRAFKPFDVMSVTQVGGVWRLILQVGYKDGEAVKFSGTALTDYPSIPVTPNKDLFYNWKDNELVWHSLSGESILKILKFEYDGDNFKIRNQHPYNIDTSKYPPFTPLFSKDSSDDYHVALTKGYVIARDILGVTGGALTLYNPVIEDQHYAISDGQQVSVICKVGINGNISEAPTIEIEDVDEDSTHFYPAVAALSGQSGEYHYKMAEFSESLKNILGGSHIDHWLDINEVDNTNNEALSGVGRLVKEYDQTTGVTSIRTLKQKDENPQIHIVENEDTVTIEGNGNNGELQLTLNGSTITDSLSWVDGLIVNPSSINWTIDGGGLHQWKTTQNGLSTLDVAAGNVATQGDFNPPFAVVGVNGLAAPSSGFVVLTIERNSTSRVIEDATITYVAGDMDDSVDAYQYVPIAQVTVAGGSITSIIQIQFQELHILEDLLVVDGEFRLVPLLMSGRNHYAPP